MWVSDSYEDIYSRAETNLSRGDYDTAYDDFHRLSERLSNLKPTVRERRPELGNLHVLSLAKQAEICHIQGKLKDAIQIYQQLSELTPTRRDSWRRSMALVRIDMGQVEEGLDELRAQAVAYPGDSRLWLAIGLESEALGRLDEAEENLRRAANSAINPDDKAEAYLALFDFYRAQGRVEEALNAWEQGWGDQSQEPDYVFPLYQMMWEVGDLERAYHYLRQEENPLRRGFHRGLLATSEGKPDEAAKFWKRVARLDPLEFDEGHEAWAEAALRVNHPPEDIIEALGAILEAGELSPRGLILQAVAEARIGHTDHAENMLEVAHRIGLRTRPRQKLLPEAHWTLFDELVEGDEIKGQLRHYFEQDPEDKKETED